MTVERTYRGVPADERRAQRHRQLLDAALALWGDPARPAVTMTGICQESGLTERYFYESFAKLDVALVAVLDEIAADIDRRTALELSTAGTDPFDRMHVVVEVFVRSLLDDPRVGRVALIEAMTREATRDRHALLLRRLARLVAREARRLHGSDVWGALTVSMFVGGVAQLVIGRLDGTLEGDTAELVAAADRAFRATAHL